MTKENGFFGFSPVERSQSLYLASWRGLSALMVLIGHAFDIYSPRAHPVWGVLATNAVLVFFALSGFFIHKALAKSLEENSTRSFVIGRINRIAPAFIVSILLVLFLWSVAPVVFASGDRSIAAPTSRSTFSLDGLLPSIFFLNGFAGPTLSANGPLWSLSYEIWYYVAAWLVGIALLRRRKWPLLAAGILLVALTSLNPKFAVLGSVWALGFGVSALHGSGRIPDVPAWPLLAVAAAAALIAGFMPFRGAQLFANMAVGLWFIAHMMRVLHGHIPWQSSLLARSAHFSYALYIFHFPLLLFIYGMTDGWFWMMAPAAMLVLGIVATVGPGIEKVTLIRRPVRGGVRT